MAHKVWLMVAVILVGAVCGCKPQTAKDLGIAGMSQYQLAQAVSGNCWGVTDSSAALAKRQRLAEHNTRIAAFISPSMPWAELHQIAQSQLSTLQGEAATSPCSVSSRLVACDPDKIRGRDESYYTVMDDETNEARDDRLSAIMGWDGMHARALAIDSAEAKLKQAEEIEKGTGCEFLTRCAEIALARASDDQSRYYTLQLKFPVYGPELKNKKLVGIPTYQPSMSNDEMHKRQTYVQNIRTERYETRLQDSDLGQ